MKNKNSRRNRTLLLLVVVVTALLLLIYTLTGGAAGFERWVRGSLEPWLEANPAQAPLVYVLAYAVVTVFLLPTSVMNLIAGAVFGPLWGLVWALAGLMSGTLMAFLIARYVAADWVESRLTRRIAHLKSGIERHGVLYVAVTRIIPFVPYSAANYGFGLTKISLPLFLGASVVFIIPRVFGWVYTGHAGRLLLLGDVTWTTALLALALGVMIILITLALPALWTSFHRKPGEQPPTWQFTLLAPVYNLLMSARPREPFDSLLGELEGPRILDLGGGTGVLALELPEDITYGLIDRNEAMLDESKDLSGNIMRILGDARYLPLKQDEWNEIIIRDALHHMGEPAKVMSEVRRVMAPGGRLLLEEFNPETWTGRGLELFERMLGMRSHFFPPAEVRKVVSEAGMNVVEEHHRGMTEVFVIQPGN